jgi:transposase
MPQNREQRRKEAMKRYLNGEKVSDICRALSCSKSFLYRWRHRLNLADLNNGWEKERSRRPLKNPGQTPETICQDILHFKKALQKNGQQAGAPAIQQALKQQGITPVPSIRTIYRILQRHEKEVK